MQIKGSIVKSTEQFVAKSFPNAHGRWLSKLPSGSKNIYSDLVMASQWYPIQEGLFQPTKLASELFFSDVKQGAWQVGRFSAETGLTGIYKVFVMIATPKFLIERSPRILSTMYEGAELKVVEVTDKVGLVHITKLPVHHEIIEHRIAGWMERALEICGCHNVSLKITKQLSQGDEFTEYRTQWA